MLSDDAIGCLADLHRWDYVEFARAIESAARAEALEEAAKVCETKEIPFDIDVWLQSTKKQMTEKTAIALADAIRALKEQQQ